MATSRNDNPLEILVANVRRSPEVLSAVGRAGLRLRDEAVTRARDALNSASRNLQAAARDGLAGISSLHNTGALRESRASHAATRLPFCSMSMSAGDLGNGGLPVQTGSSGAWGGRGRRRRSAKTSSWLQGDLVNVSNETEAPASGKSARAGAGAPASGGESEERVLVSEIIVKFEGDDGHVDGLEEVVRNAIHSKPNFSFTLNEIQRDVERVFETGYFARCTPQADDTRDGVRLTFVVQPNAMLKGLIVSGANVLPTVVIEDAFRNEFGKRLNFKGISKAITQLDDWYRERGYFGQVVEKEMLPGGICRLGLAEAEVGKITVRFLDSKTGDPTVGKTKPAIIQRQLSTKPGQVYSVQLAKRDLEAIYSMGIMEDVNMLPQPGTEPGKVDLVISIVERKTGGFSAGGGLSANSLAHGAMSGIYGSCKYSHKNLNGVNQKLLIALEKGHLDSTFRINFTDPWVGDDAHRTQRTVYLQNTRTPGTLVHGPGKVTGSGSGANSNGAGGGGAVAPTLTVARMMAGVDYSRAVAPNWGGTLGFILQRAGMRDAAGVPQLADQFGSPVTFSGDKFDYMSIIKAEAQYRNKSGSDTLLLTSESGLPLRKGWLFFTRLGARAIKTVELGKVSFSISGASGHVVGDLPPHEAFPIGGTNSVRGYDEGVVGSGRTFAVGSAELCVPLVNPVQGTLFMDYGTDLGSGCTVEGDPAGARGKPGKGYGYGAGIRLASPLGPLRLEYALNDQGVKRFHFGIGNRM